MTMLRTFARTAATVALAAALVAPADARVGGGFGSGSRGSRTFSAPAPTATAPRTAQPIQRTETPNVGAPRPGAAPGVAQPRRFGFGSGLMAGLLGAGLLGMLFGGGFFSGLGGLASLFGLLVQAGLIVGLVWLALRLFRRRPEPALAGAGAPLGRSALGGMPLGGTGGSEPRPLPVALSKTDFDAFERTLVAAQAAHSREDLDGLARIATPEMVRYFATDIEDNRRRNLRNEVTDVRLLQGDLAESWREGPTEYATVAMRFAATDVMVDRTTGRPAAGTSGHSTEATELWTFRRDNGRDWVVSAIQQAA